MHLHPAIKLGLLKLNSNWCRMSPSKENLIDPRFKKLTALVVDDTKTKVNMMSKLLRGFGFRDIKYALNETDAFQRTRAFHISIVLTAGDSQKADGIALAKLIRKGALSPNKKLPIILVTGRANRDTIFEARDVGINEIIGRPFNANTLFQRTMSVISNPREYVKAEDYFGPDRRRRCDLQSISEDRRVNEPVTSP